MPPMRTVAVDGDMIRSLRLKEGLAQKDLSRISGVAQSHISDIERGEHPSDLTAHRLARALGVPYSMILRSAEGTAA